MLRIGSIVVGLLTLLITLGVSSLAQAGFLKPDQAFKMSVSDEGQVAWEIAPHYYLYQDRIHITQDGKPVQIEWQTPAEEKNDPNFGLVNVFHNQAQLKVVGKSGAYKVSYQGCSEDGLCYPPQNKQVTLTIAERQAPAQEGNQSAALVSEEQGLLAQLLHENIWVMLATFFVLGLGLSLTPCVLPMVPILGGIIAGQSGTLSSRKGFFLALSYVLGMSVTYSVAGILVGLFGAQLNLQAAMQTPWVLSLFALVFVLLSLSMFGFYELQLPNTLRNKMDSVGAGLKGGQFLGVAIMGAVSALVVSPCVSAPLAGALLYISTTGDAWLGGAVLFVLSLGMGAPLLLMGVGGGRFIPKAGMWMQNVKAFFGVVLLGVAIALVSRFLPSIASVALWALLVMGYGCYVLPSTLVGAWKRMQLLLAAILLLYGTSLAVSVLAGQPSMLSPLRAFAALGVTAMPGGQNSAHLFNRTESMSSLQEQLSQAKTLGKPAVLDFYADWCTACKTMDEEVFSKPAIMAYGKDMQFIQLDITKNTKAHQDFMQQLGIFGPPAIIFYKADGTIHHISQGELTEREMADKLDALR